MLEALLGAPRGDEPQAKIAVGLRQLTGERVGGFVQNEDQFSLLLVCFAALCFFLSFFYVAIISRFQGNLLSLTKQLYNKKKAVVPSWHKQIEHTVN